MASRYGDEVENYIEVYLRTPGLEKKDVARALLARGIARKMAGERLLAKAQQDFQAVAKLDPSNRELQGYLRRSDMVSVCVEAFPSTARSTWSVLGLALRHARSRSRAKKWWNERRPGAFGGFTSRTLIPRVPYRQRHLGSLFSDFPTLACVRGWIGPSELW